jgi:hypothetical protein
LVLSCLNDDALLDITRDHAGEEIVEAACERARRATAQPHQQPPDLQRTDRACR